jgi:alpha-mannosidase
MDGRMENAHYRMQVAANTGAIVSLIDKATGLELVPAGGQIGLLEYVREAPHTASAWIIGQIIEHTPLAHGTLEIVERGPHRVALRAQHRVGQSTISVTVALAEGSRRIDFTVEMDWREIGGPQVGVPALHAHFPLAIADTRAWYEVANGHVERTTDMSQLWSGTRRMGYMQSPTHALDVPDVPAQKWMDLAGRHADTDQPVGATLVNLSKYGHAASGGAMRLNLVRSTYEPDPLPELGVHTIRYGLVPHVGPWTPADATREGFAFNQPLAPVGADAHEGPLAPAAGFLEVLSPGVFLSGLKRAEAGEGLVIRLYEANGEAVTARVRLDTALAAPGSAAVQTDVMEQPLTVNTARMTGDVLEVSLPAYGMATVVVEG